MCLENIMLLIITMVITAIGVSLTGSLSPSEQSLLEQAGYNSHVEEITCYRSLLLFDDVARSKSNSTKQFLFGIHYNLLGYT